MQKKIIGIFICILLIGTIIPVGINATETYDPLDSGLVEERDGVTILHVSGSCYDMVYQHGYLLRDKIEQNHQALSTKCDHEDYNFILEMWNTFLYFSTPQEYLDEIHGLADGSGISFEDIIVFSTGITYFIYGKKCMEMVAWGPATDDGELYHLYSADFQNVIKIPDSDLFLHDNQILMVREPENGFA